MKLSEDGKKWADALLSKSTYEIATWAEEDHRRVVAGATKSNPNFPQMTEHYVERMRRSILALVNAYVEGYKVDGTLIDEEDKDEILEQVRGMIKTRLHHFANSSTNRDFRNPYTGERIPNMDSHLAGKFDRLLGEAAIELNLARNKMAIEQKRKAAMPEEKPGSVHYTTNVGNNFGGIQQGGQNNTQNVTVNAEFEAKISELLTLIENSSLTQVQKLKAVHDIRAVHDLSRIEATPEVVDEARNRLEGVTSVISLSADLVSLGMPIIMILRAFFGV